MNRIEHIVEPERLLLVWRGGVRNDSRERRVVAEIVRNPDGSGATLRYLTGTHDYEFAKDDGFTGYPAFSIKHREHGSGVIDSFLRRLPPRKRDDFQNYMERHRLPKNAIISDMALLGYTNAKLPSDGFELYLDLSEARPPFELVIEVAGFRHQATVKAEDMYIGDPVTFKVDRANNHDKNAVAIFYGGLRIGFVDRAQAPAFSNWLRKGYSVSGTVERLSGKPERPLVYVYVSIN